MTVLLAKLEEDTKKNGYIAINRVGNNNNLYFILFNDFIDYRFLGQI